MTVHSYERPKRTTSASCVPAFSGDGEPVKRPSWLRRTRDRILWGLYQRIANIIGAYGE